MLSFGAIELGGRAELDVDVEQDLRVTGDRSALTQVFVNLLSNAWKYTCEDKRIDLTARAAGEREVEIAVQDNGPGIPGDEQRVVFGMFERGQTALDNGTRGSGLGLAIVQGIVKAHRGRVELESPPEGGSRFAVFLPRAPARKAEGSA